MSDRLYDYITAHRTHLIDPFLDHLRRETESLGEAARMLISPEEGDFLTLITKLLNVRSAMSTGIEAVQNWWKAFLSHTQPLLLALEGQILALTRQIGSRAPRPASHPVSGP